MPYLTFADLEAEIPTAFLIQALDDDNDGIVDAWDKVQASAAEEVDSLLEGRFTVPLELDPLPKIIKRAAVAFACELCYRRRSTPDKDNPWADRAKAFRKTLAAISTGDLKLDAGPAAVAAQPATAGGVISWQSELGTPGRRVLG
jgi:phage gp36-like protein